MLKGDLANQLLAILFVAADPVTPRQLQGIFPDLDESSIERELDRVMETFNGLQEAIEIRRVAGGYRMSSRPDRHEAIREYLKSKPSAKLSQAALETLAVVAYKQPVTLPEIMEIRAVKGSSTIKTLLEKRLIEIRGRKKVVGRPILYGTTQEFLIHFGLNELSELPSLEEFEELLAAESSG
jgi:segregation and condensation protein B